MTVRALDLFCGAGGSSWGARGAGVEIIAAFDLWSLAGDAHDINFPESTFIQGRLEEHDVAKLAKRFRDIDLIIASPECTNHSPAKGGKPRCERSKETAFQVIRFARAFRPRWIVIENVINMRKWSRYAEFKQELEGIGYNINEEVLNSQDFGVPQSRRRLFLMADNEATPPAIKRRKSKVKTAAQILAGNDEYRWAPLRQTNRAAATLERAERGFSALGQTEPFLLVYYGSDGAGGWQSLDRPLRTITTVDRFAIVRPDATHGHVMRMLQPKELQAAMGMPKKMKLDSGTRRDRIKMIGNAVCPPVMQHVVKQLITTECGNEG